MKKALLALCLLVFAAAPAWSGTVYVTLAVNDDVEGSSYLTEVRFHNDSSESATASYLFLPEAMDGTVADRENGFTEIEINGRTTMALDDLVPVGARGILEIRADETVAINARLKGTAPDGTAFAGVEIPVVTSDNAIEPGDTALLSGLRRRVDSARTDFYLLNLAIEPANCAVEVLRRGGARITEVMLSMPALSTSPFLDTLGLLGEVNTGDATIAVTCDQLTYPFATINDLETAHVIYVTPSGKGTSTLDPFPEFECPADALINEPGTFHAPTDGNERRTFMIDSEAGQFEELQLTMEFTMGGWDRNSSGNHAIFWLNRTPVWRSNVFAYFNAFGPNRNELKYFTNVGLPQGEEKTDSSRTELKEGKTYTVEFLYSTSSRLAEVVVSLKGGAQVARTELVPTVRNIQSTGEWMLVFGHSTDEAGKEVPTYGWRYSNLCMTLK